MAGATFDMITSGEGTGELVRPLAYTTTEDDATRVKVYLQLATPFETYLYKTDEGLDIERILEPSCSDEERGALVRDVVMADERVESVVSGPTVTVDYDADDGPEVTIDVTFQTITGTLITIGT
jgi:hypothetical protein